MDERERMLTAARRWCMDHHDIWSNRYSEVVAAGQDRQGPLGPYTDAAIQIFPRYNVLTAILQHVEALNPEDFNDAEQLRQRLIQVGWDAQNEFTRPPNSPGAEEVMREERAKFASFVSAATSRDMASIAPLPYRRSLSDAESTSLRDRLRERWVIGAGYWHPIEAEDLPERVMGEVVAFDAPHFEAEVGAGRIQDILRGHGLNRVYELTETGPDLEIDLALLDLLYTQERYWASDAVDWVVYVSHERSITVGGNWLLNAIKGSWPVWDQRVWTGKR